MTVFFIRNRQAVQTTPNPTNTGKGGYARHANLTRSVQNDTNHCYSEHFKLN